MAQNWLCVNAAAEGLQKGTVMMERWQNQEVRVKESRWAEEISQRWKQSKGEDRTEMKKEAKLLRCTLSNGSAWSTERKYMRRYRGKCDVFFGTEHRMRKEEMEEQLTKSPRKGGGLQLMQQESRMKGQAVRIEDIHQEEYLWQSTATWERLWELKKGQLSRSQEMKEELPKHG